MLNYRIKLAITLGLVFIVAVSLFAAASSNRVFLFSRVIRTDDLNSNDEVDQHIIVMNDTDGTYMGSLAFHINGSPESSLQRMWIDIAQNDTVLDSVTFKFYAPFNRPITIYLEAGYPPVPMTFSKNQGTTTVEFKPNGAFGQSTFSCRFVLENFSSGQISFTADLSMHQPRLLQLTSLEAHMYVNDILPEYLQPS